MMRVADYIADFVWRQGATEVFLVSGGGMMFLSDGIACHPHLTSICTHHEQAAAMAAVGYAKIKGIGAAFVTTGCGGTNALTGLLDAWQDNVACIFISGQCKRKETVHNSGLRLRQIGVQEADILPVVESMTKYAVMVNDPAEIAFHLEKAVHLAKTGRPGPVWLDIPMDVQGALIDPAVLMHFDSQTEEHSGYKTNPSTEETDAIAELLQKATRPVIIAGQGIRLAGAPEIFRAFVERLDIPVVASRLGIDTLASDHPLFIGRIGNKGDRAGNFAVQNADLVLSIGSRLSVSSTGHEYALFAREATLAVVDIDPVEHMKNTVRIDRFVNADAKRFVEAMNARSDISPAPAPWANKCREWKAKWPVCLPEYADDRDGINLYWFTERLSAQIGPRDIVVSDAGSSFYVISQGIRLADGQRYVTSGGQADMGFGLPAAIGASVAAGNAPVVAVTGDGSFQMNIQEMATLMHYRFPVKLFVWNNDGYLSIRASQSKFFDGRFIGTDSASGVSFPPLEKIAAAYGIPFLRVSENAALDGVIREALDSDGPVLCEVICIRDQEIVPSVSAKRREDGSMVSMPIEDMYPFLPREEFLANMIVKPIQEN